MGNLTTCEKNGQKIKHVTGTEGVIVGSYYGGFQVKAEGRTMMLPFENIGGWSRVCEHDWVDAFDPFTQTCSKCGAFKNAGEVD